MPCRLTLGYRRSSKFSASITRAKDFKQENDMEFRTLNKEWEVPKNGPFLPINMSVYHERLEL